MTVKNGAENPQTNLNKHNKKKAIKKLLAIESIKNISAKILNIIIRVFTLLVNILKRIVKEYVFELRNANNVIKKYRNPFKLEA